MRVVVTDYIEPDLEWERKELQKRGDQLEAFQLKHADQDSLLEVTRSADVVVVNMAPIGSSLVERWERCRLVIRHGIGYDNVDVEALTARGIPLVNVPDYCVEEVAEQAIALIFALGRKVVFSRRVLEASSQAGSWDFRGIDPIFRMKGQVVGIVGCGRIGTRVYQKLASFGFQFRICDPYLQEPRQRELGVEPVSLEQLLRESDFVTLHIAMTDETRRLINRQTLGMMKATAYLVNTSRAGLVDHEALRQALVEGRIAGAGLDVFEREPPDPRNPLFALDNVVLTPHLSWCSQESAMEIRSRIVEEIDRLRSRLRPLNCVNPEVFNRRVLR